MRFFALFATALFAQNLCAQYELSSPDGQTKVRIQISSGTELTVEQKGKTVLASSPIGLSVGHHSWKNFTVKTAKKQTVDQVILNPVPERRKTVKDHYNEIRIDYQEPFSLECRAYNDGVAYRWVTRFRDSITIEQETARYRFPAPHRLIAPEVEPRPDCDSFHTSFETPYRQFPLDSASGQSLMYSPLLVVPDSGPKLLITESDLEEYPGMFFRGTGQAALEAVFARYPLEEFVSEGEFPQLIVKKRAPYIARTQGNRTFPWRVFILAGQDKELASSDLVYRLASPSRITDYSWIQPGQGTDEWIIGITLFNVPFKAGINTETYRYYIDFARRFGFERIMLDAGWSDNKDLFKINPNLDMDALAAYARERGVKLSMWTLAMTLDRQLEPALEQFNRWGVDFIMTDFMDRDDQKMVRFYHRIAEACARKKIMIMYHGACKPAGFNRTWPNAVTREGVLGSEYNIWSDKATPEHDLLLPFIRMAAGPMDYEPGLLDNATKETFRPIAGKVMSQGTRCHQLAMFVVYESPMQIFSGNPSQGMLEPDFMDLLGSIPTTWDETLVLDGKVGDFIVTARKKGDDWFIGSMTDWTPREILEYKLDFLDPGAYEVTVCRDGLNADRSAADYRIEKKVMGRSDTLTFNMAPGGGFLARFKKVGQ